MLQAPLESKIKVLSPNHLINVLTRTFVKEFYQRNAGFFLLFGTLAFGFMSEIEHEALAQFFVSSVPAILIPVGVWVMYAVKILRFNNGQLQLDAYRFLFNIQFIRPTEQLVACALIFIFEFFPAVVYGIFLIRVAGALSALESIAIILMSLITCLTVATFMMMRFLRNPWREVSVSFVKQHVDRHFVRPALQFYVEGLLRKDPMMLAATKLLTGALIFGVCMLHEHEIYDGRFVAMTLATCGIANLAVIFYLVTYEHFQIGWMKNLPIKMIKRFLRLLLVLALFMIPEVVVLMRNFPGDQGARWIAENLLFLLSLMALLLGLLHTRAAPLEYFTRKIFWVFIVLVLLILFKVSVLLVGIINITLGYALFKRNYYLLESTGP